MVNGIQWRIVMARTAETDSLRAVKREKTSDADTARLRTVKRERLSKNYSGNGRGVRGEEEREEERLRTVKRQRLSRNGGDGEEQNGDNDDGEDEQVGTTRDRAVYRRELRSRYTAVKNLINDEKDDLNNVDSDKFRTIIREVDNLHQLALTTAQFLKHPLVLVVACLLISKGRNEHPYHSLDLVKLLMQFCVGRQIVRGYWILTLPKDSTRDFLLVPHRQIVGN
ncbi:hypothetical protein QQ045_016259 [Rhodiola kirilowii]